MRTRFVLGVLVAAGLVLLAACYFRSRLATAPPETATAQTADTDPAPANYQASAPLRLAAPPLTNGLPAVSSEDRQDLIDAGVERLEQLALNDDPASLTDILQALTSSEKEIRHAAIEAAKEFGSSNAIPALKAAAESAADLKEKIEFLEAADFLSLPQATFEAGLTPLTPEQQQADDQRRAQRQLRRQTRLSQRSGAALPSPAPAPAPSPPQQP
jgi:hypothetical protein